MAGTPDPVRAWSTVVPPAWIDYNGHLNEGYYGVAFGDASDGILTHLGFDAGYRAAHGTFYTAETRIRYLREVHGGHRVSTDTWLLGADEKRLHVHHVLLAEGIDEPAATQESMMLHVVHGGPDNLPRVGPMAEPVLSRAAALAAAHASVPLPDHVGLGVRTLR